MRNTIKMLLHAWGKKIRNSASCHFVLLFGENKTLLVLICTQSIIDHQ